MQQNSKSENGNVFIIILVAVALFGALIFTFSRSGSQGISSISKQEAKIAAQEIINYARLVEGAVDRVRRNGCSENEISFENLIVSGYSNSNSPSDNSCHVFDDNGGKISYKAPKTEWLDGSHVSELVYGQIFFTVRTEIPGVGIDDHPTDSDGELIMNIPYINKNICLTINALLKHQDSNNDGLDLLAGGQINLTLPFNGVTSGTTSNLRGTEVDGTLNGCFRSIGAGSPLGSFHFYHVLLAR